MAVQQDVLKAMTEYEFTESFVIIWIPQPRVEVSCDENMILLVVVEK